MYSLKEIFERVQVIFEHERFIFDPKELYEPIDYTLRLGGKRLRPALLLTVNQMMGGDIRQAEGAALGIETFHNFTLLHDDIMDKSPLRRGKPTVWTQWNANTAILSGDTMYAMAWRYFLRTDHPNLRGILNCFNETAIEVCEGQQYDMNFESSTDVTLDRYIMMICKKTAVLLAGAMKIGAMYAGCRDTDLEHIYNCGINMGLAFQIQDDLLDSYGNQATFGKPIGQDIRDNKKTYMILKALELSPSSDRETIKAIYDNPHHNEKSVSEVINLYDRLCVKDSAEKEVARLMNAAETELHEIKASDVMKQPLIDMIDMLIGRKR